MITELATSIKSKYDTLSYNGEGLSSAAPLYFGIAPDMQDYPFTSYFILDTSIDKLTTCTDSYDFMVQFSVFDKGTSPLAIMGIMDVIIEGYNETTLVSTDGTLLNIEPKGTNIVELGDDHGHEGIVEYRVFIEKTR